MSISTIVIIIAVIAFIIGNIMLLRRSTRFDFDKNKVRKWEDDED